MTDGTRTIHDVVNDLEQVGKDIGDLTAQISAIHDTVVAKQQLQASLKAEYETLKAGFEAKFLATESFMQRLADTIKSVL